METILRRSVVSIGRPFDSHPQSTVRTIVNSERKRVGLQLVVHKQDRAAVCRNHDAGFCVFRCILFPALLGLVGNRRVVGVDGRTDRAMTGFRVVVHVGGFGTGVVILLEHINDGIVHRFPGPLGIKCGVPFHRHRGTGSLSQSRIQIPAAEIVPFSGGHGGGNGLHRSIGNRDAAYIAAAVGLISEGEILAGIVNHQFLLWLTILTGRFYGRSLSQLQNRIIVSLHRWSDIAVQDAFDVRFPLNFSISVSVQILEHIDKVIYCCEGNVFETDLAGMVGEVVLGHRHRGGLGIIDRSASYLICAGLSRGWSRDRIGQLMGLHLQKVGIPDNLITTVIQIVILYGNVIDINLSEYGHGDEALVYDRSSGDFGFRAFLDPLLEDLAGLEGILRHRTDGFAGVAVILGKGLLLRPIIIKDDKPDIILIRKVCYQREIGVDGLSAVVLGLPHIPADEILALDYGGRRKDQRFSFIITVGLMGFYGAVTIFIGKGDGEDVLFILRPDGQRARSRIAGILDVHLVREVAAAVDPLAGVTFLFGNCGNVVQAVGAAGRYGFGFDQSRFVFFIKFDRIYDLIVIRDDGGIRGGLIVRINPWPIHLDLVALSAIRNK